MFQPGSRGYMQLLLFAPLALILPTFLGLNGIWISIPISDALIAIISIIFITHSFISLGRSKPEKKMVKSNA